jgi:hypothetical protein
MILSAAELETLEDISLVDDDDRLKARDNSTRGLKEVVFVLWQSIGFFFDFVSSFYQHSQYRMSPWVVRGAAALKLGLVAWTNDQQGIGKVYGIGGL